MKGNSKPTAGIILETRKPHKDGKYPVKLRVTHVRKRRYYTLWDQKRKNLAMSKDKFERVMAKNPRETHRELRLHLDELKKIAIKDVIDKLPVFTWEAFETMYFNKRRNSDDVFSYMEAYAVELRRENRISTSVSFDCAAKSMTEFYKAKPLHFEQVNMEFLRKYESWMLSEGNSYTTIGIYLRNVRTVFNQARRDGIVQDILYPFGDGKYQIPTGRNLKKALKHEDVVKIASYKCVPGSNEHLYRDLWVLLYLCNGINVKDMARIRYRDFDGEVIRITRAKTERETRKSPRPITIIVVPQITRIINRWGRKPKLPDTYVMPILESELSAENEYKRIQDYTKRINRCMKDIAQELEIKQPVTTMTARHSFATVLKRTGASTEFISESLGHTNVQTTDSYLGDFEMEEKKKWAEKITEGF